MISDTHLHALTATLNAKRRANTTTVKVDAEALAALVETHHALYSRLHTAGKLAVTLGADHVSLVGDLSPADFKSLANAVDQRRTFIANAQKESK